MAKLIACFLLGVSLICDLYKPYFLDGDTVTYQKQGNLSYVYDGEYKLLFNDTIVYQNDTLEDLSFCKLNNNIYVLVKRDNYHIYKYSLSGNLLMSADISSFYLDLKIGLIKDRIVLFGKIDIDSLVDKYNHADNDLLDFDKSLYESVLGKDYFLEDGVFIFLNNNLEIEDTIVLKGRENECIENLYYLDDKIYITGKKGNVSGGIYGNGGGSNAFYAIELNDNYEVVNRQIFKEKITNFKKIGKNIIISTISDIYTFEDLNCLISSLKMGVESDNCFLTIDFRALIVLDNKAILIDLIDSKKVLEIDTNGYDFSHISEYVYLKKEERFFVLDIINDGMFLKTVEDGYYEQAGSLEGLYGVYELVDTSYNPFFDRLVYGSYQTFYKYKLDNLVIKLEGITKTKKEVNVKEGMIYPLGYHLLFSGNGYLNDKMIYQYQEVEIEGLNVLRLEGTSEIDEISFYGSSEQVSFSDDLISSYDYYFIEGSEMKINIDANININSVIVNGYYYDVIYENDEAYINVFVKEGINGYFISAATLEENGRIKTIPINYFFKVLGVKNNIVSINSEVYSSDNEVVIRINFEEGQDALRVFVLKVEYNNQDYLHYYPLGNGDISLEDKITGDYNYQFFIGLYNGSEYYDLVEIFKGSANGYDLFKTKVVNRQEYLEAIDVVINKSGAVKEIEIGNEYISIVEEKDYKVLVISIIISIIIASLIIVIRYKKRIKQLN